VLCFFQERRRSEEECWPWADVRLIAAEAEALEEAAPRIPWQQLRLSSVDGGSRQSALRVPTTRPFCAGTGNAHWGQLTKRTQKSSVSRQLGHASAGAQSALKMHRVFLSGGMIFLNVLLGAIPSLAFPLHGSVLSSCVSG